MERFIRTLKDQHLYLHPVPDLEEAGQIIGAFIVATTTNGSSNA